MILLRRVMLCFQSPQGDNETHMDGQGFELGYQFGANLREAPTHRASMQAYLDALIKELKNHPSPPTAESVRLLVRDLGNVGTYARILGKYEAAERALDSSLELIEKFQLSPRTWALHTLRMGNVYRDKGDALAAEAHFRSILELGSREAEIKELEDFVWQEMGKLYFDQQNWDQAEIHFLKAYYRRKEKGDEGLMSASRQALKTLKTRMGLKVVES